MAPKSLFVVIEGIDRVGKNTQADLLVRRLAEAGEKTRKYTTPDYRTASGDLVGRYLRGKVGLRGLVPGVVELDPHGQQILFDNARSLNSLMIVNRYEVAAEIRGSLEQGLHVVCVRWWPSPYLYGLADGLDGGPILEACAHLPEPDLYVLLDADVASVAPRLDRESRYEARLGVQEGLARAYRKLWAAPSGALSVRRPPLAAGERPGAWAIVQASASQGEVHERVWRAVLGFSPGSENKGAR